jgi:hypothetical protein
MKKSARFLSALLTLPLALSLSAFASSDGSGEASDSFNTALSIDEDAQADTVLFTIGEDGVVVSDSEAYDLTGEITAQGADGIDLTIYDFSASGIQVTSGAYTIANSTITSELTETTGSTDAGGYCAGVTDGLLTITDSTLISSGKGGVFGNYTVYCAENGTLVVIRSNIIQLGTAGDPEGYTDAIGEPGSNGGLLISGYSRANMSMGVTKTYYYGSYVETDGWAAMSTDMTRDLSFYAFDSVGKAVHGGYGTYADSSCKDYFYGSVLSGAEIGAIIANNGEIYLSSGDEATEEALAYLPEDYEVSEDYTARQGRSLVEAGRNCLQIHSPEESKGTTRGMTAVFNAAHTDFVTSADLDANANLVDWAEDYGVSVAEYIDFVKGAVLLVKSAYADIDLTDCTTQSTSDTLLMTAVNSDSMSCYALTSHDMTGMGTDMTLTDCDISGDVKAYDYQRNCTVNLVNTTWSGAYETWTKADWDGAWSDECKADELCYWILDAETYHDGTGNGSTLTLDGTSRWVVTGASQLTWLTTEAGAVIEGTVTVDGVVVDVTAGGSWSGDIVVTPLTSGEPS